MKTAEVVESLMVACGNLPWSTVGDAKGRIADGWLNDILPAGWVFMVGVQFDDGSIWDVWTW